MKQLWRTLLLLFLWQTVHAQKLELPSRSPDAMGGSEFAESISKLDRTEREEKIYEQIAQGNVPAFLRQLIPIKVTAPSNGKTNTSTYYVTPDYLAVGSDQDYFLCPLSPITAQKVADLLHCSLPTRKMVDDIYSTATLKLAPSPIPPSPVMATMPIFLEHNQTVWQQRKEHLAESPLGTLVGGHKKDVVISNKLQATPGKVAIYGWHRPDGKPIQPLFTGHGDNYADYSHGIRLVQLSMEVNGDPRTVPQVLANPEWAGLLSDEGVISIPRYPKSAYAAPPSNNGNSLIETAGKKLTLADFQPGSFGERTLSYVLNPDIKVHINAPAEYDPHKKLQLIFFALPNGNSTEQTIGRQMEKGDDWHYDIQHIGAQTRFLRETLKDSNLVVVYLEASEKSWPAWRKKHADLPKRIPDVVDSIKEIFHGNDVGITLSGHSGGGSFIFGYLNGMKEIPNDVERIAFLDGNYAYDALQGHPDKIAKWLKASDHHYLSVLAYNDAVALLNGTNFVSSAGGTWGRSHQMIQDLSPEFRFTRSTNTEFESYSALQGRVKFLLKENPGKKIFHTVQVERNGFIQSLLSGTTLESQGYNYFGDRAYTNWIDTDQTVNRRLK
ncbi:hypothetical protein [Pedosphaera parvula]|uniref:Uncharacterized protein n=1 Tax=Pedosphaera parvula (strain Ellin514) TaxID=320771 RepID=B9XDX5_PEDPL|nr:hypothetical protein [Pedosphaera parvula]EEF61866.1 hypothetical protein Cflav_PD4529 [Pedosphaera parvula Ellin514]